LFTQILIKSVNKLRSLEPTENKNNVANFYCYFSDVKTKQANRNMRPTRRLKDNSNLW